MYSAGQQHATRLVCGVRASRSTHPGLPPGLPHGEPGAPHGEPGGALTGRRFGFTGLPARLHAVATVSRKVVFNVHSAGQQDATRQKGALRVTGCRMAALRSTRQTTLQRSVCGTRHCCWKHLRGHSDPETAATLVIHTAVAYSQLRGLNEFAFDTDATST